MIRVITHTNIYIYIYIYIYIVYYTLTTTKKKKKKNWNWFMCINVSVLGEFNQPLNYPRSTCWKLIADVCAPPRLVGRKSWTPATNKKKICMCNIIFSFDIIAIPFWYYSHRRMDEKLFLHMHFKLK